MSQIQHLILEILVNPEAFNSLKKDPRSLAKSFDLSDAETQRLLLLNPREVQNFRDIVIGTRAHRIREMLPLTSSSHSLDEDLKAFFSSTAIRQHQNEADFFMFVRFMEAKYRGQFVAHAIQLDRAVIVAGDPELQKLHAESLEFKSFYSLEDIMAFNQEAQPLKEAKTFKVVRNPDSSEVDVYEVDHEL